MGDPKRTRKKYKGPNHPWQAGRIDAEKVIVRDYGLVKKRELWKANSLLAKYKNEAKKSIVSTTKQGEIERQALLRTMQKYGLLADTAGVNDVLGLTVTAMLERRLQTILVRKKLAGTMKQARQFILHGHISVTGTRVTSPSYLVPKSEETMLAFPHKSPLNSDAHPEREKALVEKKVKERPETDDRRFGRGRGRRKVVRRR